MGKKDIIKIENEEIETDLEMWLYRSEYHGEHYRRRENHKKMNLTLPRACGEYRQMQNPRCITSVERELPHVFNLTGTRNGGFTAVPIASNRRTLKNNLHKYSF